jgi:hypothetical protein
MQVYAYGVCVRRSAVYISYGVAIKFRDTLSKTQFFQSSVISGTKETKTAEINRYICNTALGKHGKGMYDL